MIKVGVCVAYDWEFLKTSLPLVYEDADIICLAIDKDRHSWKCNPYAFNNEQFFEFVKSIDTEKKIDVYEDDFSLSELNSRENGNRHRMMIAERLGKGGWHIQLDSDEYFLDFRAFVKTLNKIYDNPSGDEFPVNVCSPILPIYKKLEDGYLLVSYEDNLPEMFPIASNKPNYQRARHNGYFNIYSKSWILHETWAREEKEMLFKITNWGHSSEELKGNEFAMSYFKLWQSLNKFNFQFIRNFHPAKPSVWTKLTFIQVTSVSQLKKDYNLFKFPLSDFQLKLKNSIHYSRLSKLFPFLKIH